MSRATTARAGGRPRTAAAGPVASALPSRSRRGTWRARILAGVLGTALLAGGAEAAATAVVENGIEDALRPRLGRTDADLAGSGLLALARGRVGRVTVTGDDAALGRVTGASVRLGLDGVPLGGGGGKAVDAVHGRITVPTEAVRAWLTTGEQSLPVSEVTTDPATGVLHLGLGPGGALGIAVRPHLHDGRVEFTLDAATLMGSPAPERLTRGIRDRLAARPGVQDLAPALKPTSVRVTDRGIEAVVDARHVGLAATAGPLRP
ncbi:LmeA family phospholipid-binding protein [Streptomyces sp. NPDC044571]|uniref:LmeA family phospholipid-binding protein n=1 Tax=Streptomyces sp. NPDC044571 TaxID=3155371 RepID=UPI0033E654C2